VSVSAAVDPAGAEPLVTLLTAAGARLGAACAAAPLTTAALAMPATTAATTLVLVFMGFLH
jgi:hypothetical protein